MSYSMEMQREWSSLSQIGALTLYGDPFLPQPTGPRSKPQVTETKSGILSYLTRSNSSSKLSNSKHILDWDQPLNPPLLKYEFFRFIKNFPCLREANLDYWQERIQPFFDSFC